MTISDNLRADAWASESDLHLVLLEITHADLAAPIRVVNNTEDVVSNSITYSGFPFEISLPDSNETAPPRATLTISNIGREIGQAIRAISSPPTVKISVIRQQSLDTVEIEHDGMRLSGVTYTAQTVSGDLVREDFVREPYPAITYSPADFNGLGL